jgi:hypothetical protein
VPLLTSKNVAEFDELVGQFDLTPA